MQDDIERAQYRVGLGVPGSDGLADHSARDRAYVQRVAEAAILHELVRDILLEAASRDLGGTFLTGALIWLVRFHLGQHLSQAAHDGFAVDCSASGHIGLRAL